MASDDDGDASHQSPHPRRETAESRPHLGKGIRLTLFYLLSPGYRGRSSSRPYLFSVFAAFKTLPEILAQSRAWPPTNSPPGITSRSLFTQYDFGRYLLNTLLVTVILTAGQVDLLDDGRLRVRPDGVPGPGRRSSGCTWPR